MVVVDDYDGCLMPVVVVDGESHSVREVSRGVLVPSSSSSSSSSSSRRLNRAYWLQSELRGAIYGRIRRGTTLCRLDPPVLIVELTATMAGGGNSGAGMDFGIQK